MWRRRLRMWRWKTSMEIICPQRRMMVGVKLIMMSLAHARTPDGVAPRVSEDQISPPGASESRGRRLPCLQRVELQPPVASTAPRSLLPARPPVAKGAGKGKAAAAKPKALSKTDIPPGFKRCSTCLEALPESSFEDKRNVCKDDDLACESLQRVLCKKWGKNYKTRVTKVKKSRHLESRGRRLPCVNPRAEEARASRSSGSTCRAEYQSTQEASDVTAKKDDILCFQPLLQRSRTWRVLC